MCTHLRTTLGACVAHQVASLERHTRRSPRDRTDLAHLHDGEERRVRVGRGDQRWRPEMAIRGGKQRWQSEAAIRGGNQMWQSEVAIRGGNQVRLTMKDA